MDSSLPVPQWPSTRILPALTCCNTVAGPVETASICPPNKASTAGPAPVKGTWVSAMALVWANISMGTCMVP